MVIKIGMLGGRWPNFTVHSFHVMQNILARLLIHNRGNSIGASITDDKYCRR
uniref:Uncharacterized protein n=1 Tax=Arundo donax TaxID=35708 RepID=A0A0A9BZW6_ARUDO